MKKLVFLAVITAALLALAACGNREQVTLRVFNWGEFNDPEILRLFEEETGIAVFMDFYATNQEMYARIVHQGAEFDVLFPSDYMVERLILEERLAPLNWDNIPNMRYLHYYFDYLEFDPRGLYSVPYMWGMFGILYNTTMVQEPVYSWNILWNERYSGDIYMYNSMRDTMGLALSRLGFSQNTKSLAELHAARDSLIAQRPLVRAYQGDLIRDSMIAGGAALAPIFSGCAWFTMGENPDLNFVVPVEGTQLFVDAMVIPVTTRHQREAEMFINFMMRPDIALMNAEWVGYSTTNAEALEMLPDDWRESDVYWPSDEIKARGETFRDLGEFTQDFYDAWMMVLAAR
jgi:spermidine/putrescine transport system substrate-binding protein